MVTSGVILTQRYLLQQEVGAGGMGAVYEATDLRTGAQVAVKVLHPLYARNPQYINRLRREAQIAASIRTPRVVRVVDLDEHEGMPYLVMEYVAGETLSDKLRREGPLSLEEAISICIEVNRALEGAFAVGVLHRDLKPANVKITEEGEIKVLDFGIARAEGFPGITGTDMFTGTPEYCAPERMDGTGDIRADIYAIGIMLYELLTGRLPFTAATAFAVLRRHEMDPIPSLPEGMPEELQEVIERCLAKRQEDRYQTPGELMIGLRAAAEAVQGPSDGPRPPRRTPITPRSTATPDALDPTIVAPGAATVTRSPGAVVSPAVKPPAKVNSRTLLIIGGGGGVLALAAVLVAVFLFTRPGDAVPDTDPLVNVSQTAAPPSPSPSSSPSTTATATPPSPLLAVGQRVPLTAEQTVDAPISTAAAGVACGVANPPTLKSSLRILAIEQVPNDPRRVRVTYQRTVPAIAGYQCIFGYGRDAGSVAIEILRHSGVPERILSVGGSGIAVNMVDNIYGRELDGTWLFDIDDLSGSSLSVVQFLPDQPLDGGKEFHRLRLLPVAR